MRDSLDRRPDPDQLLRRIEAVEEDQSRGKLKVFLGYAPGVGKSFRMLDEGRRRGERGQDVVVGAVQPRIDATLARLLTQLEIIPLIERDGFASVDVETLIRRRPQVCLIDGLAYDNPPGSPRASRWNDVEELLSHGISVIASINLGFVAEYCDQVEHITGKRVTATVPVSFIDGAEEITLVDAPADAAQNSELREMALVLAASVVDRQLETYLERHGVRQTWGTQERVMVCLTPRADGRRMLEIGRRVADSFHGELLAAHVRQDRLSTADRERLEANLAHARDSRAEVHTLNSAGDPIDALLGFATQRGVTQMFVGHSMRVSWKTRLFGSPLDRLLRCRRGLDVRVFPH